MQKLPMKTTPIEFFQWKYAKWKTSPYKYIIYWIKKYIYKIAYESRSMILGYIFSTQLFKKKISFYENILNKYNQSVESLNVGKKLYFDVVIKPIQWKLIHTTEVLMIHCRLVPGLEGTIYTVVLQNSNTFYYIDIIINRIYFCYFWSIINPIGWV